MKTFLRKLKNAAGALYATLGARLAVYLQTEPVRARSALLSALVAASTLIPALADRSLDQTIVGVLLSVLPVIVGETARAKVSPVDEK